MSDTQGSEKHSNKRGMAGAIEDDGKPKAGGDTGTPPPGNVAPQEQEEDKDKKK